MDRSALMFDRPAELAAATTPEARGLERDEVRLLVSTPEGHSHARFLDLPDFLRSGDLLVVNHSATLPASLPAAGEFGRFQLNLSTHYGRSLWLAEPRWTADRPGPLPIGSGDEVLIADIPARLVSPYPGIPALWFVQAQRDLRAGMACCGHPIRYGYVDQTISLDDYQTIFASRPGSAEMPSAGRPFTRRVLRALRRSGVEIAGLVLHTGVSSQEVEVE